MEVRAEIERKLDGEAVQKAMADLKEATPVVMNPDYFGPAPAAVTRTPGTVKVQPQPPAQPK
jgi:hypothetical protein